MNLLRRGASTRLHSAKGAASAPAPAPLDALPEPPSPGDYAEFLRITLPKQEKNVASHRLGSERVWLKKAGPRHGKWGYRVMAAVARMARLDIIKPVPNPGGEAAIATEARRLKQLAAAGLRVPTVLAQQSDGLLISDLGESGRATVVLQERLDQAAAAGPAALLAVWREGLAAIAAVHVRGQHLSQAFDRNLVQCPDGVIGYIDFEDDPAEVMTLTECQARDWLSYLHSTAMMLEAAAPQAAGQHWHAALATVNEEVRERIANAARRMRWARKLPASRRWGRDTQRVRAVARLLGRWHDAGV
ncbi:hypothetical protein NU688_20860 [Variovorax sp. ZS18.2.2]|uniref:hypothetical protein n=1 Tax=Variovorax sp. ZS18.2.2 TaxID=2971255 RepID=UPI002150D9A3|nr:hypothetical protein [Variovorax sp. ZS18.2.2]MCR6478620.1 hypothetical protein [Variovorax sp. ZS18.2.2]